MTDQDQRFQNRWEFRRTENDCDTLSDDDHSRPNSASEPKLMKHKLVTCLSAEENTKKAIQSPTSFPRGENDNHSSFQEHNRKQNQPGKMHERKARPRRAKRTASNSEPSDAALIDLKGYMESLVEGIKIAREDLLAWMSNEMISSSNDDIISSKPSRTRKGQRHNAKRSKTPKNNQNSSRRRSGKTAQNCEDGSSRRRSCQSTEEVVMPPKEGENVVADAIPVEKTEKQKGKISRLSTKKQKLACTKAEGRNEKAAMAAAADNNVTLPTVLPQNQVDNSQRNPFEDGNERDVGNKNALNSKINVSSHQLNFDARAQQKDGVSAQIGMRIVSDHELNTFPTIGNGYGNGNGFPFPLAPQVSNVGIGIRSIPSHLGLQYLTQGNTIPGMYREPPRFTNENQAFVESYGASNQQMKFNVQQGGVMGLQSPDVRRGGPFKQGTMTSQ